MCVMVVCMGLDEIFCSPFVTVMHHCCELLNRFCNPNSVTILNTKQIILKLSFFFPHWSTLSPYLNIAYLKNIGVILEHRVNLC